MKNSEYKIIEMNSKASTCKIKNEERLKEFKKIVNMSDVILINEFAGIDNNNELENYMAYFDDRDLEKNGKANQCIIYIKKEIIEEKFMLVSIGKDFIKEIENVPDFIHIRGKLKGIRNYVNFISLRIHTIDDFQKRKQQFNEINKYLKGIVEKNEIFIVAGDHNCGHMDIECYNCISNCNLCTKKIYENFVGRKYYSICDVKKGYEQLGFNFLYNTEHGTMFNSFMANFDFFAIRGIEYKKLNLIKKETYLLDHIPISTQIPFDEV